MHRIKLDKDIQPLSEFRSKVAFYFDKVKKTKRPLIITQNGKSAGVLLAVSEYEAMVEKIETLEDIKAAEDQINNGMELAHQEVIDKFSKRIKS